MGGSVPAPPETPLRGWRWVSRLPPGGKLLRVRRRKRATASSCGAPRPRVATRVHAGARERGPDARGGLPRCSTSKSPAMLEVAPSRPRPDSTETARVGALLGLFGGFSGGFRHSETGG